MTHTVTTPLDTERDAREAARPLPDDPHEWPAANLARLMDACADAGVPVGDFDSRIMHWPAGYEPAICAVTAGLISRAHVGITADQRATVLDALDVAADAKRDRAANCPDCDASPAELCGTCEWRLACA